MRNVKPRRGNVFESYRKIGDDERQFDIAFWQRQGDQAIFDAAFDLVMDYLILREGHAVEPRLQRTVESFQRL